MISFFFNGNIKKKYCQKFQLGVAQGSLLRKVRSSLTKDAICKRREKKEKKLLKKKMKKEMKVQKVLALVIQNKIWYVDNYEAKSNG